MARLSPELARPQTEFAGAFAGLRYRRQVASLLEVSDQDLIYFLYRMPKRLRYRTFQITKKNGNRRDIRAPNPGLKILQQKLNQILLAVYRPKASAHGFVLKRSIVTNAAPHRGMRHVFNVDIQDFFPSINFGRVRGLFMAKPYNLTDEAATILAQICCHDNQLPQGAPTSPVVSNMICSAMDSALQKLAQRHFATYSRYADDITFSKSGGSFPVDLCKLTSLRTAVAGDALRQVIEFHGFRLNDAKTRMQSNKTRQTVTGLVVNVKPNVERKFVREVRAMIFACRKFGVPNAQKHFAEKYDAVVRRLKGRTPDLVQVIRGKIEFIRMVKGDGDAVCANLQRQLAAVDPEYLSVMMKRNAKAESRDIFISHASEDKAAVARPLAEALVKLGCKVWYDEYELRVGDSLRAKIDDGLTKSRFGVVVLSPAFFAKPWPKIELDGLTAREVAGRTIVLPIWHNLTSSEVATHSPTLAGKFALSTTTKTVAELAADLHGRVRGF